MFKISPIQDKNIQKQYALECGAEFRPDSFAYSMIDQKSGELMGMAQFDISGECGYIYTLREKIGYTDFEAMFILGRATMNFIDTCGIHICRAAPESANERLLKSIGFKSCESGKYVADMTGMFDGHCDGNAVSLK